MDNPQLSIITITYRDAEGLGKTLASLEKLKGSGLTWESVVIDSSPELSKEILSSFDFPIRHFTTPPAGIYSAFNEGIKNSQGECVWFLNSGDKLFEAKNVEKVMTVFSENSNVDIVGAGVDLYRDEKFTYSVKPNPVLKKNLVGQNALCHQGLIYRRSVFNRVGLFDEKFKLAGDYDHHWRCVLQNVNFKVVEKVIAEFDRGGRSDNFVPVVREFKRIWAKHSTHLGALITAENRALGLIYYLKLMAIKSPVLKPLLAPLKPLFYRLK